MKKLGEIIRHNVFLSVATVICICLGIFFIGCDSETKSPFNPAEKITREQLIAQVDYYNSQVKLAFADLDKQDVFKEYMINVALSVAEGGTLNPSGIIVGLIGILGLGATADNIRKNTIIKTLKNGQKKETVA